MSKKPIKHITILIYAHPELYPPTLSAIEELSQIADKIDVVTRNMLDPKWEYPKNVRVHYINKKKFVGFEIENISFIAKIIHFLKFVIMSHKLIRKNKSKIVLAYDAIPLYVAHLLKATLKKQDSLLWYHNHDVTDLCKANYFSIMSVASRKQDSAIQNIGKFSLPSKERLEYFKNIPKEVNPIIIPNYPLKKVYSKHIKKDISNTSRLRLVYQGSIGKGHGLESIIKILNQPINNKSLELHLVGKIRAPYLQQLNTLAKQNGVLDRFKYHGMKPFTQLPAFLSGFDVGIAIHKPYNITYATGGSASNKIYEYAALGMPVLLFDNEHYRSYLGDNDWSFFTDLTHDSLINSLMAIHDSFSVATLAARKDFLEKYNYGNCFQKIKPLQTICFLIYV
ncbi:glycosyltransferase [Flavobacteriaceae bacterium]|nr:glycosyltransferase [Flavobacteriaceae bacterium]